MSVTRYWCQWALLNPTDTAATPGALVEVDGRVTMSVTPEVAPPADARRLRGLTIPGLANAHSHAFHRALRGRTGERAGSFWTWRERMYEVAARLDPDSYYRLARAVYAEMALAGVTCVGEFHYLHHNPGGTPYDDRNAMGAALAAAADDAGVRITLLDTCYLSGGLTGEGERRPLEGTQLRFGDGDVDTWAERVADLRPEGDHVRVGAAVHSVRAVDMDDIRRLTRIGRDAGWCAVHAHLAEQSTENAACEVAYGRSATGVLSATGFLDTLSPTLVHATHLTPGDSTLIRESGARVCLCPTTERDLADGLPPLADLSGVGLALGSDGHSTIDMFEEARGVEMHERLRTGNRGNIAASSVLEALHAPAHAEALGWGDGHGVGGAGRIAPGHRADLVTLDLDSVRLAGLDPARATDAVVAAATASDVAHVMADGRWIVREGAHVTIPDTADELDTAIKELYA